MRTCQCMSHFVYNLRSRPLVRDLAARVRGQIASDHCRSDLITGPTHWARAGYPFPEVNVPEKAVPAGLTDSRKAVTYIDGVSTPMSAIRFPLERTRLTLCDDLHVILLLQPKAGVFQLADSLPGCRNPRRVQRTPVPAEQDLRRDALQKRKRLEPDSSSSVVESVLCRSVNGCEQTGVSVAGSVLCGSV